VIAIPTHAVWPYVQQYNLSVQGELPSHVIMQASYVGSLGVHLPVRHELNQLTPLTPQRIPTSRGRQSPRPTARPRSGPNNVPQATVNGQPVNSDVATRLYVACGNSADPFRPYIGTSGITNVTNSAQSYTTRCRWCDPLFWRIEWQPGIHLRALPRRCLGRRRERRDREWPRTPMSYATSNYDETARIRSERGL
jgi:hypothetical protein